MSDSNVRWNVSAFGSAPFGNANSTTQPFLSAEGVRRLLGLDPDSAVAQAEALLKTNPTDPSATYVLGTALRKQGRHADAAAILKPLAQSQPQQRAVWDELGRAWMGLGQRDLAIHALLKAIDLDYFDRDAWLALGDLLDFPGGGIADAIDPSLQDAQIALRDRRLDAAGTMLHEILRARPDDTGAMKLLADVAVLAGRWNEAEALLTRTLEAAPDFTAARFRFVTMRIAHRDLRGLQPHIDALIGSDPDNRLYLSLKALTLWWGQQFDQALAQFEAFIDRCDDRPGLWLEYARLLRAIRSDKALAAYIKVFAILPSFAEAYVTFANIKSFKVDDGVVGQIRAQLARADLAPEDRARLHYVLGKALEDRKLYDDSFENYRKCNEILRSMRGSAIESSTTYLRHAKAFFTQSFFHARAGYGCKKSGPIFIVGLPRSGSTLVEQILSSHSEIEALGERNDLMDAGRRLAPDRPGDPRGGYPYVLEQLGPEQFQRIGEEYLRTTDIRRKFDTAFFTDKMPGNHHHIGLIHLTLPNARIIDVRRHPLDCCFSCFKHFFQGGHSYSLDLGDIGRFYSNYVELMAHFDATLPGRVHRVFYENLVGDFETEVRRLLDFIGLPFEEKCLRFHENDRLVATLSADQVNRPLYSSGMGQWRHYEKWLDPLKHALGPVLAAYPSVPEFSSGSDGMVASTPAPQGQESVFIGLRRVSFQNPTQFEGPETKGNSRR